jgi:TonB family protein
VGDISIMRAGTAYSEFEAAAIAAIRQWRYEPALRNGEPIDVMFRIYVQFMIH